VRKAARANLDGGVTRELAGMKSVPVEEIAAAWEGTPKKIEACRHGRGFGTRDERLGARSEKAPDVDPPVCPHCGSTGVFREGKNGRPGFYGCPKYKTHESQRWIVDGPQWVADAAKRAAAAPTPATASSSPAGGASAGQAPQGTTNARPAPSGPPAGRVSQELHADDVFGPAHGTRRTPPPQREPGEEG